MSPIDSWNPNRLRLVPAPVKRSQSGDRRRRRGSPVQGKFIAGPVDVVWLLQARRIGVTALLVGLALWHIKGLRKTETFIVSNLMLQEWDIQPDAKRRALRALERAGLVKIERRGKRSPQVTLVVKNGTPAAPYVPVQAATD
jgi:hypothetical protein